MKHITYTGRLVRSPQGCETYDAVEIGKIVESRAGLDYQQLTMLENDFNAPILITFRQHFSLLLQVAESFSRRWPSHHGIYIRASRFYPLVAPRRLVAPDVFFVDRPSEAAAAATADGGVALAINDWFRRLPYEWRDNGFRIDLFGPMLSRDDLFELIGESDLCVSSIDAVDGEFELFELASQLRETRHV